MAPATSAVLDALVTWVEGDTWAGISSVTVSDRVAPGNLASVKMAFTRRPKSNRPDLELTTANGGITITDAANWVFTVNSGRYALPYGKYFWQIETSDASDPAYVETLLAGEAEVFSDYTTTT